MQIVQFPCLSDNFGVLIHDPKSGATAAIDVPEAGAVRAALAAEGWRLSHILVTHRHHDHIAGIAEIVAETGAKVIAPAGAADVVPGAERYVREGDRVDVGGLSAEVWDAPGHSPDHVIYHFASDKVAFVGDVLFALGCGRVFDNDYDRMWQALARLGGLPDATALYFGHEYTVSNGRFALSVDPGNAVLQAAVAEAEAVRARGGWTSPTTVGRERAANPFLRATDPAMAARLGLAGQPAAAVFRELRERKNRF